MQTVKRRSLRSIMPDAAAVFQNLFKTLEIQEPAFKNVVILYRRMVSDKPERKSEYEPIRAHNTVRSCPLHMHAAQLPSRWLCCLSNLLQHCQHAACAVKFSHCMIA
jgi:hypothetical protein